MKLRTLTAAALVTATLSLPASALAAETGDTAEITGRILRITPYTLPNGAEMKMYLISRPVIDGENVRSAYLRACLGPSEEICNDAGYEMVNVETGGSRITADGLITLILHKLYYDTYYMNAVTDIVLVP